MTELFEYRLKRLEKDVETLQQAVDAHRKRLHKIENDDRGVTIAAEALRAYREQRNSVWTRVREWGGFVVAAAVAIVVIYGHLAG